MSKVLKAPHVTLSGGKYYIQPGGFEAPEGHEQEPAGPSAEDEREAILSRAESQAERTVKRAQVDALRALREAQGEIDNLRTATREAARAKGYADGLADGRAEGERLRAEAKQIVEEARERAKAIIEETEPQIVELTMSVCEKILGAAARFGHDAVMALIRQGLSESTITGDVIIRVSKEDYEAVVTRKEELTGLTGGARLEIAVDPSSAPCDCMIETPFGSIDVSLDSQFEVLKQNIYAILGDSQVN